MEFIIVSVNNPKKLSYGTKRYSFERTMECQTHNISKREWIVVNVQWILNLKRKNNERNTIL